MTDYLDILAKGRDRPQSAAQPCGCKHACPHAAEPTPKGRLIAKAYDVTFDVNGRIVRAPGSYALLHDPDGHAWPRCSVLVAPFQRGRGELEGDGDAEKYFGYTPKKGTYSTPPRNLSSWKRVGEVARIDYRRPGSEKGRIVGDRTKRGQWFHPFKDGGGFIFQREKPILYRMGRMLRLELQDGCVIDWRGFSWP